MTWSLTSRPVRFTARLSSFLTSSWRQLKVLTLKAFFKIGVMEGAHLLRHLGRSRFTKINHSKHYSKTQDFQSLNTLTNTSGDVG